MHFIQVPNEVDYLIMNNIYFLKGIFYLCRPSKKGEVSEWSIVQPWKGCVLKGTAGSNPAFSAKSNKPRVSGVFYWTKANQNFVLNSSEWNKKQLSTEEKARFIWFEDSPISGSCNNPILTWNQVREIKKQLSTE